MSLENGESNWSTLLAGIDLEQPVGMLNQIRFRDKAQYEPGSGEVPCSGADAYARYGEAVTPILTEMGAGLILSGIVELIGARDEWDMTFIVRYQRAIDLVTLPQNERYAAAVHHRTAAVADSRLMMMQYTGNESL